MAVIQTEWTIRDANSNKTYRIINADYNQYPLARGKANSFCATMGLEYNRGWVLMKYADVKAILDYSATVTPFDSRAMRLELTISGKGQPQGDESITHKCLKIKSVVSATPGYTNDDSCMLVELVDAGYFFTKFDASGYLQYNPFTGYYSTLPRYFNQNRPFGQNATGARTLESYNTIFEKVWSYLPIDASGDPENAGTYTATPSLPISPSGYPENVVYGGGNTWEWLHYFIAPLWCVLVKDTTLDYWSNVDYVQDWSVVQLGTTQAGLAASEAYYLAAGLVKYDSGGLHDMHVELASYLNVENRATQSNGTDDRMGRAWINDDATGSALPTALFHFAATGPSTTLTHGVAAWSYGPTQTLFDSAPFNYGKYTAGATLPLNDSTPPGWSVSINQWRYQLSGYYAQANSNPIPRHTVYAGVCTQIKPGSEVRATLWRNYGDGTCTEVVKYPGWPKSIWCENGSIADQPALVAPRKNDFDYRRQLTTEVAVALDCQRTPAAAYISIGSQMSAGSTKFNGTIIYPSGNSTGAACLVESMDTSRKLSSGTTLGIFDSQYTYGGVQYPLFKVADANGQTKQTIVSSAALGGIIPAGLTLTTSTVSRTVMNDAKTD